MLKKLFSMWKSKVEVKKKGFTLLELLIVIAIIAALSVILVIVLNPAETLKKSRDTQRMSDMSSLKTAIGLYTTSKSSPFLASGTSNTACKNAGAYTTTEDYIWYSAASDVETISDLTVDGATFSATFGPKQVINANLSKVDATGWLPVKLTDISGGSPLSNLPLDPVNKIANGTSTITAVTADALVYRYACNSDTLTYEINAQLESTAYTSDDDKRAKDGGNSALMYEMGTDLATLGANNATAGSPAGF